MWEIFYNPCAYEVQNNQESAEGYILNMVTKY